ncbi:MAG: replicative DNA helicase [Clostridiales bacterium]|nr:replicative DNA helicase [Clostridiales bacterium]
MPTKDEREQFAKKHPNLVTRETPNSYEAETALLGGMLIDGQTASKFMPELRADDFYTPAHKLIYEAIAELFTGAKAIDLVTVVGVLEKSGTLEMSGGVEYLTKLIASVPSTANSEYYFDIVKKYTRLRAIIDIAKRMADEAYSLDPDDTALSRAEAALYGLAETNRRGKPENLNGYVDEVLKDLRERATETTVYRGVPTGFAKLDTVLGGGFQKSDLIILAARPGQGKTSFAMNCAVNAARRRRPDTNKPYVVAVFSLEMSAVQLAKRILCSVGEYDMSRANRAVVSETEWDRLYAAKNELLNTQLYVDESGNITPAEILSKCRALKHSVGLDFIMIDYLQLMQSGKKLDNFVREVAEITRAIKLSAKELDVPILLLSQMSRSIEQRKGNDKESRLSDLRDSGAIEQDADIVLFIDRKDTPGEGDKTSRPEVSEVYLNVAKHRNGETGNIKLLWHPSTTTFSDPDMASRPDGPPPSYSGRSVGFEESAPPPDDYEPALDPLAAVIDNGTPIDEGQGDSSGAPADAVDSGLLDE